MGQRTTVRRRGCFLLLAALLCLGLPHVTMAPLAR